MKLLRLLRGVIGTAAAWSLACVPLSLAVWGVDALVGGVLPPRHLLGQMLVGSAVRGAVSGAAFAVLFAIAARRRSFATLRARDMLFWGAIGGVVVPLIGLGVTALTSHSSFPAFVIGRALLVTSIVGAATAAGTLWIARRAPELKASEPELLAADVETA